MISFIFSFASRPVTASALFLLTGLAAAQTAPVKVDGAWVRATVQGQRGTGAFMNLTASQATRLVGVSSPVAGVAEVHEMKMDGEIMKMRAVSELALPPGQTVQLKPGSYHLMLMDLKLPLSKDSTIAVTLRFKDAKGVESKQALLLPVALAAPATAASPAQAGAKTGEPSHKH